jgi:hypothetical protein
MAAAAVMPAAKALATMDVDAGPSTSAESEDLYARLKTLQRQLEFLEIQVRALGAAGGAIRAAARGAGPQPTPRLAPRAPDRPRAPRPQEEYIKEEQKNLKRELLRAQEEVKRIQSVPLVIGQFLEMVDANSGIVGSTTGSNYHVRILSTLNRELLKPSASVALHRHSNALVDILPPEADSSISLLGDNEKPNVTYQVRGARGTAGAARAGVAGGQRAGGGASRPVRALCAPPRACAAPRAHRAWPPPFPPSGHRRL